jgi:hypothetical protein
VACFWNHCNENLGSVIRGEFLDQLNDYQLLKDLKFSWQ